MVIYPQCILHMGKSQNCGCLVIWFYYQLIAKQGNKTTTVPWPDPYTVFSMLQHSMFNILEWDLYCRADGYQRLELAVREVKVTLDEAIVRGNMRRTSTTADEPDLDNGVTRGAGVRRSKSALSTMSRMSLISRRRLSMRHTDSVDGKSIKCHARLKFNARILALYCLIMVNIG